MLARAARLSALPGLLTLIVLCASSLDVSAASLLHKHAPRLVRTDINGHKVDLAAFKGRVVLLTFWATWCEPCQVEMPRFIDWQTRYGPQGLQIIGVSMDDDEAPVLALIAQRGVNYPVIMGDAKLARRFGGILGLPVTFVINRKGKIVQEFNGETNLDTMEHALFQYLAPRR